MIRFVYASLLRLGKRSGLMRHTDGAMALVAHRRSACESSSPWAAPCPRVPSNGSEGRVTSRAPSQHIHRASGPESPPHLFSLPQSPMASASEPLPPPTHLHSHSLSTSQARCTPPPAPRVAERRGFLITSTIGDKPKPYASPTLKGTPAHSMKALHPHKEACMPLAPSEGRSQVHLTLSPVFRKV